jgi:hypothetical protein
VFATSTAIVETSSNSSTSPSPTMISPGTVIRSARGS